MMTDATPQPGTPARERELSPAKTREAATVRRFIEVYCHKHHRTRGRTLCPECDELAAYALRRLTHCPFEPKPKCKECKVHCYQSPFREKIREVMKFSGMHFARRGRIDWLIKYFLG
ncbi:MAG: hypothetical protein BIFFINMI_00076 [Phycisphaerae bacterium]|nr:hypothetical protein [Phycisphaerae bacterium]